jgi:peptide chain release factor 2
MYTRWAQRHEFDADLLDFRQESGILRATLHVRGPFAYGQLWGEAGLHRRSLHPALHLDGGTAQQPTSAAVDVLPELAGAENVPLSPEELRRDSFRTGGPLAGQHDSRTASGVRLTHLPTGLTAECHRERSQHKNDRIALGLLKAKLYRLGEQEGQSLYDEKGEVSWQYLARSYSLAPTRRVMDARTGVVTDRLEAVLDGDLVDFVRAHLLWRARPTPGVARPQAIVTHSRPSPSTR